MNTGKFVISLDFELLWGMIDVQTAETYGNNILGVHTVIPKLLQLFEEYKVNVTFATVGFLFFENKQHLLAGAPAHIPGYSNDKLNPYKHHMGTVGDNYTVDKLHFAPQLIKLIQQYPRHEIGSHTFSHYYCLEKGQSVSGFKEDMMAAKKIAQTYGIQLTSLVFPRNQFKSDYIEVCKALGIICYRGNENSWLYKVQNSETKNLYRRAGKLVDTYINISGHNCYTDEYLKSGFPVNIPASRFLRPYSKKLKLLDSLKLSRIRAGMAFAAKNSCTYHLWWHPHNFGIHQQENLNMLTQILNCYKQLNAKHNFKSYTMSSLTNMLINPPVKSPVV